MPFPDLAEQPRPLSPVAPALPSPRADAEQAMAGETSKPVDKPAPVLDVLSRGAEHAAAHGTPTSQRHGERRAQALAAPTKVSAQIALATTTRTMTPLAPRRWPTRSPERVVHAQAHIVLACVPASASPRPPRSRVRRHAPHLRHPQQPGHAESPPAGPYAPESTIPLRQIDLPLQIDHLRQLGADFAALHTTVTALNPRPGSELLQQLAPKVLSIHELVGRTLVRLSVLDGSQYTAVPGSRASLETLSEVVASASVAASQLARAIADNPLEAAAFTGGPPLDDATVRQARHTEATPLLAESLTTAAHHLDLCATCCHYTAAGITRDLKNHPEHRSPLPQLTQAQYKTLAKIAQGGARPQDPTASAGGDPGHKNAGHAALDRRRRQR
ncbi:hypothetical protein GCM10009654_15450 [Streptomyces hebeiensis]|uniref:DUF222 domain-containing protein n=1 Tax=Streptomyces hebeiensis TaxID=229486 RepID=A0ABN1UQS3_9ACTN